MPKLIESRRGRAMLALGNSLGALICGIVFFSVDNVVVRILVGLIAVGFAASAGWLQHRISSNPITGPRNTKRPG